MTEGSVDHLLQQAAQHYASGQLAPALECAQRALQLDGEDPDVLHLMGLISYAQGKPDAAIDYLRKAIESFPGEAEFHNNLGVVLRSRGDHESAGMEFQRAVELDGKNASAAYNLGTSRKAKGKFDEAEALFQKAVEAKADFAAAHCELGNVLAHRGKGEQALKSWQEAVRLDPKLAEAQLFLGYGLAQKGQFNEARQALQRSVDLVEAKDARAWWLLGSVLYAQGQESDAVEKFQRALAIEPNALRANLGLAQIELTRGNAKFASELARRAARAWPESSDAYYMLGLALEQLGNKNEAGTCYRAAIRLRPDSEQLKYILAAISPQRDAPAAAPRDYLATLFGQYAQTFDSHLVQKLHYRVPEQLLEAVTQVQANGPADILDLGCGTVLVGEVFKPMARSLVGVDLVPEMLAHARERNVYTGLAEQEIAEFLRTCQRQFDIVAAADVFIYIGELAEIFRHVARVLRPGGLFVFSLESMEGDDGYRLQGSRRYAHSLGYIRKLAAENGLAEAVVNRQVLRKENEMDIEGWVVVLRFGAIGSAA